ncbi:hypothetical protein C8J55DRAFT_200044 [Lentinula edodes]|uniref:Uncharacterized protein n=1 Tax=Lentinula lateritia TaxID=40482 RepID=A0A9W8ZWA2_9AGAR|nr:hypothetical protein C8J55DRAFT_200044 [Lentinula edodes]
MTSKFPMDIPFGPFEAHSSIDTATPPTLPNLSTPNPPLGEAVGCSGSMSPTMASVILENVNTITHTAKADLPPIPPLDLEPAPDLPPQQRSPLLQVSFPAPSRRSRPRQRRTRVQGPTLASQDDLYPTQGSEESLAGMEAHSLPLDIPGPRYQPYRVPRARTGSGFHHPPQVTMTSDLDLEAGHPKGHLPTDQEQHPSWAQEPPQTLSAMLDIAWYSGGKTSALVESHLSHSMPLHSAHPAAENVDSQLLTKETGIIRPANPARNPGDSVSWNYVPQKTYPGVRNLHLVQESFLPQSGTENIPQQLQEVGQEQVARGSLSVELQDSRLEIERMAQVAQHQRTMSYSYGLRLQQEDQLRKAREKVQAEQQSTTQTMLLRNPHHLDHLQQYRRRSLSMLPGHQLLGHTDRVAHLARPSSQIDMGMGKCPGTVNMGGNDPDLGIDHMALSAGDMALALGMGAHSQTLDNIPQSMASPPGPPVQMHLPALQQAQGHHYLQEVHHRQAPSRQQAFMLGDEHRLSTEMRMGTGSSYGRPLMFPPETSLQMVPSELRIGTEISSGYDNSNNDHNAVEVGDGRGLGMLREDDSPIRVDTRKPSTYS